MNINEATPAEIFEQFRKILNEDYSLVKLTGWVPRHKLKDFFKYGDTQMAELEKNNFLECSKVGKRKFYSLKSIQKLLESHMTQS